MAKQYKYHPAATAYPLLSGDERTALVESIRDRGLLNEIVLLDGMIVDGRNRYECCEEACVPPRFREYDGDTSAQGIADYVRDQNANRRHLRSDQKAAAIVLLDEYVVAHSSAAKERQRQAGKEAGKGREKVPQNFGEANDKHAGEANEQLAKKAGTNRQYVTDCKSLLEAGNREAIEKIRDGELTLSQAKAARRESEKTAARAEQCKRIKKMAPAELEAIKYRLIIVGTGWVGEKDWPTMGTDKPLGEHADDDCLLFMLTGDDPTVEYNARTILKQWGFSFIKRHLRLSGVEGITGELMEEVVVGVRGKVPWEKIVPRAALKCSKDGIVLTLKALPAAWLKEHHAEKLVLHFAGKEEVAGMVNWPLEWEPRAA